jgi:1-acyl-sn-glycerol-3-phosphate acyltransferase
LVRYLFYRLGTGARPNFLEIYPELIVFFDRIMKWPKRLRVECAEHCPRSGPAVFAGNHFAKDDPFMMYRAIHRVCEGAYPVRYMMRDDFFASVGGILKSKLLDLDDLLRLLGALPISRGRVQLAQLKPFIALLREQAGFLMYPGRSRSRTGVFIEYREGIEEPGGVTFLVAQAQRNCPDLRVAIVPMARTQNMATKKSAVVFGPPVYLPHDADRAAQRDLDFRLIELMGDLVEINMTQIVAGIIYLHCLHSRGEELRIDALDRAVASALAQLPDRHIDPAALSDRRVQLEATLDYFAKSQLVLRCSDSITPIAGAVLASPPHDTTYRPTNPIKYAVNQILHLSDAIDAIERAASLCGVR